MTAKKLIASRACPFEAKVLNLKWRVSGVTLWSTEHPKLYTLKVVYNDGADEKNPTASASGSANSVRMVFISTAKSSKFAASTAIRRIRMLAMRCRPPRNGRMPTS